jgi:Ca2+-binding EF-hand superfamily protein
VLRLHPRAFRERFGEEMISIFDEHAGGRRGVLLADAIISLFRQWVLRPRHETAVAAVVTSDMPVFHIFESSLPCRSALVQGAVLSLVFFGAVTAAIGRGGHLSTLLIGAMHPRPHVLPVDRSSVSEGDPTTLIKVADPAVDPLYQLANFYFKIVRVLDVVDADRDRIISASEIIIAPAALARLDRDHDGKLSPEECGFSLGMTKLDPQLVERARLEFMRLNPVLAALDADHDGEISAGEIRNSSVALRTLDKNGDGSLTPVEVIPDPIDNRTAMILSRLDTNRDGKITQEERANEEAAPLQELLDRADRNRDGVTTRDELSKELQLRDELKRELERAMRSVGAAHPEARVE